MSLKAPTTSEPLHKEASRLELTLTAMIQELKYCSGPQNDIVMLNTQIRQLLVKLDAKIQALQRQATESKNQDDREALNRASEWHSAQYNELEKSLRRANLTAKAAMDARAKRELFDNSTPTKKREDSVQASSAATESLVELRHRLSTELDNSKRTLDVLAQSSGQITATSDEMKNMAAHIQSSHRLVTKFGRREVTDILLIMAGVAFFFVVVLYILKKRTYG